MFGTAFAAFCVWLTVRIINRRERWTKWTAIAILTYLVSFGPACWLTSRSGIGGDVASIVYLPLVLCWANGPQPLSNALDWWMHCGASERRKSIDGFECILIRRE
jgi:hypothetical protein